MWQLGTKIIGEIQQHGETRLSVGGLSYTDAQQHAVNPTCRLRDQLLQVLEKSSSHMGAGKAGTCPARASGVNVLAPGVRSAV